MAEIHRSYNFTYGNTLRVKYETELGAIEIALEESGGRVTKTFPQKSPVPPYRRGDTFVLGPELDAHKAFPGAPDFGSCVIEVEECSVSDNPIGSTNGTNLDRVWRVSVTGRIVPDNAGHNPLFGSPSDIAHPVGYSYDEKFQDGRTVRSGSLTLWSPTPESDYSIGDNFAPIPGKSIEVTGLSISDQVIGKAFDGSLRRLWRITVTGDESIPGGGVDTVNYSFSKAKDDRGIVIISGSMTKTSTSEHPPVMPNIEDKFIVPYIGEVTCTKVNGTQSAPPGEQPSWSITVDGSAAEIEDAIDMPEEEESVDYTPNGVITRDVAGNMVVLLRSNTPRKTTRMTRYTASGTPLAVQGGIYNGMICVGESIAAESIKVDGVKISDFFRHDLSLEY